MLTQLGETEGFSLQAFDDPLGSVKDFLFDDRDWAVRYVVVDTRRWLPGRKVVLHPDLLDDVDWDNRTVTVRMTKEQVEAGPGLDEHEPVSRQIEDSLAEHYGWPRYWMARPPMGVGPAEADSFSPNERVDPERPELPEPHLRSVDEVTGYYIEAADGKLGHVYDFLADTTDWTIRDVVIDTRNWLPGKKVLLSPGQISAIVWETSLVRTNLTRDQLREQPALETAKR